MRGGCASRPARGKIGESSYRPRRPRLKPLASTGVVATSRRTIQVTVPLAWPSEQAYPLHAYLVISTTTCVGLAALVSLARPSPTATRRGTTYLKRLLVDLLDIIAAAFGPVSRLGAVASEAAPVASPLGFLIWHMHKHPSDLLQHPATEHLEELVCVSLTHPVLR